MSAVTFKCRQLYCPTDAYEGSRILIMLQQCVALPGMIANVSRVILLVLLRGESWVYQQPSRF